MKRHRIRRLGGTLVALGAASALLAGCSGNADTSGTSTSDRSDTRPAPDRGGGHSRGEQPEDAFGQDEDAFGQDRDAERKHDFAPEEPDLLSTFALDVDTASYGYARRALADGRLPDPSTVRPEEFLNSFRQDYERPDGNGFTVTVDGARTGDAEWSLVRVGLATRPAGDETERPPAALTFVIDVSGSMAEPGRLDLAKKSLAALTDQLRDDDSVALVTFTDEAETVLPMTRLDGDRDRDRIRDAVDGLETHQATNLGAGVETGYATAVQGLREGATNRVVLISDALANTGDTDADSILEKIAEARTAHGITLFGVGVGSDYGDALMERLADRGDGHTSYVSDADDAREVFVEELPRTVDLTARDAKAQVAFDPETVEEARLIGYDNRQVADDDFRDDRVDGGEIGPGHTVTALYAVRTGSDATGHLATATVRWQDPDTRTPHEESGQLEGDDLAHAVGDASDRFQVTAVAAYFADALRRDEPHHQRLPAAPTVRALADHADALADTTADRAVRDLAEAIDRADRML
ncbi:von Willebrand factor type A domain-containing protein [Streptomyces sp. NPDC088789]|uniref:vWA domain-containing protein n=1 Tax=Streptomyces sp. NPDC088789 TaxID=3365899 RepID=UPI00381FAA51